MSIEAMKQALEALASLTAVARRYLPDYDEHPEIQKADAAITSLRQAIEQAEKQEPVQEPVYKVTVVDDQNPAGVPLSQWGNTPAAQRQWVGLTDEEKSEIWADCREDESRSLDIVEAKLKEKNHVS